MIGSGPLSTVWLLHHMNAAVFLCTKNQLSRNSSAASAETAGGEAGSSLIV